MPRHRIREIAVLAGLSEATVDRVLHGRGTTRSGSADAVRAAVAELDRQQGTSESEDQELNIEAIVLDDTFRVRLVRQALQEARSRAVHTSFRTVPRGRPELAMAALARVQSRRPQGVLIDLEDDPAVVEQAATLMSAGIPVVTMGRALPSSAALGHSGLDNRAAGATAAYLLARAQPDGAFAVAHSEPRTAVEQDRVAAFVATVEELHPGARVSPVVLNDGARIDLRQYAGLYVADEQAAGATTFPVLRDQLHQAATIVGHRDVDLLPEIATRVFDFVLDVDWQAVVDEGCRAILEHHSPRLGQVVVAPTPPSVLTPYNLAR